MTRDLSTTILRKDALEVGQRSERNLAERPSRRMQSRASASDTRRAPFSLQSVCRNVCSTEQPACPLAQDVTHRVVSRLCCTSTPAPRRCVRTSRPLGNVASSSTATIEVLETRATLQPGVTRRGRRSRPRPSSQSSKSAITPANRRRAKRMLRLRQPPIDRERCATVQWRRRVRSWPELISASQAEDGVEECTRHR